MFKILAWTRIAGVSSTGNHELPVSTRTQLRLDGLNDGLRRNELCPIGIGSLYRPGRQYWFRGRRVVAPGLGRGHSGSYCPTLEAQIHSKYAADLSAFGSGYSRHDGELHEVGGDHSTGHRQCT